MRSKNQGWWCLRWLLPLSGALAGACGDEHSVHVSDGENVASTQQALTLAVPNRIRALDFDAYNDTTSQHLGSTSCGTGPVDAETTSEAGSGGCNIGWTAPGEWLDYTISAATAGKYNFVPRVASANAGKTFRLLLDGQDISGLISTPSNGWQAFASREVKNVTVGAGTHTLRVKFETNETNLAYIDVTPGTVDLPARIEAEAYQRANESTPSTNSGNACDRRDGVDKENTGDSAGGGCNIGWTTAGEWVEYDVNVNQAGSFDIKARVGSALTGKTAQVSLDGNSLATLSVPNGGWTVFEDRAVENVFIGAGPHTLRVTFPQGDVNLNYLDVVTDSSDPRTEITGSCSGNPSACCPNSYTPVVLTSSNDNYSTTNTLRCIVGLGGHDTINAPNSVVLAGPGNDTFQAANGDNFVVPGDGVDTVSTGTGNDTVFIFDLCELDPPGETIDMGTGYDTLVAPVPLAQLQALGLNIANVDNVVVQQNSCRSECVTQPDCSGHGHCGEGASPGQVGCVCDPGHSGPDCGTVQCSAQPDIPMWRQTGICDNATLDADIGKCMNDAEAALGGTQTIDPIADAIIPNGTYGTTCSMTFIIESIHYLHDGGGFQNVFGWYPAREDSSGNPIAPAPSDLHVLFGCGDQPGDMADPVFPSNVSRVGYFVASNQSQCVPTSGGVLTAAPQIIVYSEEELNPCGWTQQLAWGSKASPGDAYWGFEDLTAATSQAPDFDFEDFLLFVEMTNCDTPCSSTSECAPGLVCVNSTCVSTTCTNGVKDGTETDVDCGGNCPGCDPGDDCSVDGDCDSGLVCPPNNGACYGDVRSHRKCWSPSCQDGVIEAGECGLPDSPCGFNCACVNPCNAEDPTHACPPGEVPKPGYGAAYGAGSECVCLPPECPSNDPQLCGSPSSLCGPCITVPDCSEATCANPSNKAGGVCPGVCDPGECGCTDDIHCDPGFVCMQAVDGCATCRPSSCAYTTLVPPLCGSPGALCGDECPTPICIPRCDGRDCGPDPNCGESCGTCAGGASCNINGLCETYEEDEPISVPDDEGGDPIVVDDLPEPPTNPIGAVPGQFSVSEQGTAEYSVPIDVPPGRAGIEPALSLRYSGSRVNGQVGVGWRLEGLSKITRCPRIHALDGVSAPIKGDTTDRFCFDGKRLEMIPGQERSYGGNNTEYRTLIDTFTKIVSYKVSGGGVQHDNGFLPVIPVPFSDQGPDYFKAWTKDGRILTYGRTQDSLVMARDGVRHVWLLNKVEDRAGNTMEVRYTNKPVGAPRLLDLFIPNALRPSVIAYTGHGDTAGNREVRFSYDERLDPQLGFLQGGVPQNTLGRLTRITTYVKSKPVKSYKLKYFDEELSQVHQITECAGESEVCKQPTTFDYVQESGFELNAQGPSLGSALQLDVNGDGIPDFMKTVASVEGVPFDKGLAIAQVSTDIAIGVGSMFIPGGGGLVVNTVWGLMKDTFWGLFADHPEIIFDHTLFKGTGTRNDPFVTINNVDGSPCPLAPSFLLDYDHDGNDDIISACGSNVYVSRSTGDGNFELVGGAPIFDPLPNAQAPIVYDIDGDALPDILHCRSESLLDVRLRLRPQNGVARGFADPVSFLRGPAPLPTHPICKLEGSIPGQQVPPAHHVFDLDGDGAPELFVRGPANWQVLRFKRENGELDIDWEDIDFPDVGLSYGGQGLTVGDFNGDGLWDVWQADPVSSGATAWINTGNRRFTSKTLVRPRTALTYGEQEYISEVLGPTGIFFPSFAHQGTYVIDYDADGRSDILEQWDTAEPWMDSVFPHRYNEVLTANSRIEDLFGEEAKDLYQFAPAPLNVDVGGEFARESDVDGDGNPDLFGSFERVFYGKGVKNNLLQRVEDGLGNFVEVKYHQGLGDRNPYVYNPEECQDLRWPETCLPKMSGLVSSHEEGFTVTGGTGKVVERQYSYTFYNGRMNLTGHGWLGFDRRETKVSVGGTPERTVTTTYEPVARYYWGAAAPEACSPACPSDDEARVPYVYPLAGLPQATIIDDHVQPLESSPLEAAKYDRRTRVEQNWEVVPSTFDRPFPRMTFRNTRVFERERPEAPGTPLPFDENGLPLVDCFEDIGTDLFGNTITSNELCQSGQIGSNQTFVERTSTSTPYDNDVDAWLISNPDRMTVSSIRGGLGTDRTQVWDFTYDSLGQLETVTRAPQGFPTSSAAERNTVTYVRDDFGSVRQVTEAAPDEVSRTTAITYDSDNIFPETVTNALGHVTKVRFDKRWGRIKAVADPNGIVARSAYDGLGLLGETSGAQGSTVYTYSSLSSTHEVGIGFSHPRIEVAVARQGTDGTSAGSVVRQLDNYGRLVHSRAEGFDGNEIVSEQAYDTFGRLLVSTAPHTPESMPQGAVVPTTTYSYDYLDRVTRIESSDGTYLERQYASTETLAGGFERWFNGLSCGGLALSRCGFVEVIRAIDEEGKENVVITDYRGNVLRSIDGDNVDDGSQSSNYRYEAFNSLVEMRDNRGLLTSFEYDDYGRVTRRTDPDLEPTGYIYNGFDELEVMNDPSHLVTFYEHDRLGRLMSVVDEAGTSEWIYDQGQNGLGRLSETRSPGSTQYPAGQRVEYAYDPRGLIDRLDYIIDGIEYSTSFDYDDLGRAKRVLYPRLGSSQRVITENHYDGSGTLTGVDEVGGANPRQIWRLNEAFQGHLTKRETFGNGAVSTYGYDEDRYWLESVSTVLGSESIQGITYQHYDNGQLYRQHLPTSTRTYDYDNLHRLSAVTTTSTTTPLQSTTFGYDDIGNIVERSDLEITYRTDKPHQIDYVQPVGSITPTVYEYDEKGNVSRRGIHTFEYTPFNLPKSISRPTANEFKTTRFEYTADEERVVRRDDEETRHFVTDLYQRLIDSQGDTIEERFQLYAGGRALGEIVRTGTTEKTLYFHTDRLGSADALSNDSGESFQQEFDAFGEPIDPPAAELTRFGFTGHQHDRDLGVIDMRGRLYDPLAGRFMSPDPLTQAPFWSQGLNPYSYVFNDPINRTDPSGFLTGSTEGDVGMLTFVGTVGGTLGYGIGSEIAGFIPSPTPAGAASGGVGGTLNVIDTMLDPNFGGASPGRGPRVVEVPTAPAPNSGAPTQGGGTGATAQLGQGGPPMPGDLPGSPVPKGLRDFSSSKFAQDAGCPETSGTSGKGGAGCDIPADIPPEVGDAIALSLIPTARVVRLVVAGVRLARVARTAQILINAAKGAKTEAQAVALFQKAGYRLVGRHVPMQTGTGRTGLRYVDAIFEHKGELFAVEIKSGNAVRSAAQLAKDRIIAGTGAKVVGKTAPAELFGRHLRLDTIEFILP